VHPPAYIATTEPPMRDIDDPSPVQRARTCCHQSAVSNAELAVGGVMVGGVIGQLLCAGVRLSAYLLKLGLRTPRKMRLTALTSRTQPTLHRLQNSKSSRIRSPVHKTIRAVASGSSPSTSLNKVVFTVPWKVHFGQSLNVSGEGEELGQWNPDKSLPLAWNQGDLWAAEIPLPSG